MYRRTLLATLFACNTPALSPVEQAPLPQTMVMDITDPLIPGGQVIVTITGAPPNSIIKLIRSDGGIGPGDCPPVLRGKCMDIAPGPGGYRVIGITMRASSTGIAQFLGTVPSYIPTPQVWSIQAVNVGNGQASNPLVRRMGIAPCVDDALEDNDDVATAKVLNPGDTTSAVACPGDADWYRFDALQGDYFEGSIAYDDISGDVDGTLYDVQGVPWSEADYNQTNPDPFDIFEIPADGTYFIETVLDPNQPFLISGSAYDLDVDVVQPDACPTDAFEPNDTSASAVPITEGSYPDLGACYYVGGFPEDRFDWYTLDVAAGNTITLSASFEHDEGDIDLYLFDFPQSNGAIDARYLRRSFSSSDDEYLTYDVTTTGTYYIGLRVFADDGTGIADGNRYDLDISIDRSP